MTKPNDYITDLFKKLREDISEIKHKLFIEKPKSESALVPHQYAINAVHENEKTNKEAEKPSFPVIHARLNLPQTIAVKAETEERTKPWREDRHFLLQIAAIVVGGAVSVIYYLQWQAMVATVNVTRQASERDERAWLKVTEVGSPQVASGQSLEWSIQIQNIGKSPARKIHGQFMIEIVPEGAEPNLHYGYGRTVMNVDKGIIYPQDFLTHPVPVVRKFDDPQGRGAINPLQSSEFEALGQNKSYIVLHGWVDYRDTFGTPHWAHFCIYHADVGRQTKCATEGNDTDNNTEP